MATEVSAVKGHDKQDRELELHHILVLIKVKKADVYAELAGGHLQAKTMNCIYLYIKNIFLHSFI